MTLDLPSEPVMTMVDPSQLGQAVGPRQHGGIPPDGYDRGTHRQWLAPAIGDHAAISGNLGGANRAHVALVLQELIAPLGIDDLQ